MMDLLGDGPTGWWTYRVMDLLGGGPTGWWTYWVVDLLGDGPTGWWTYWVMDLLGDRPTGWWTYHTVMDEREERISLNYSIYTFPQASDLFMSLPANNVQGPFLNICDKL